MSKRKTRKSIRSLATSPLVDLHISLPENVVNLLDGMKDEFHVSRSVVISQLIQNEHEALLAEDAATN